MIPARLTRFAHVVTPLALLALAGSAGAQPLAWTGNCGVNWTDVCPAGVCPGPNTLFKNNFDLTICAFTPSLPGATNSIFLGSNIVVLNTNASVASVSLNAGGSLLLAASLNTNNGIFQNVGAVSGNGNSASFQNMTLNNVGTFNWPAGTFFFQNIAFNNTGSVTYSAGNWPDWTGTNSLTQTSGSFVKNTVGSANISVASAFSGGSINVTGGGLQFSSSSLAIDPLVAITVASGAALNITNQSIRGTVNSNPVGFLGANGNWNIPAGQPLTLNVGGAGWQMSESSNLSGNGGTLTNKGLITSDASPKSLLSVAFVNDPNATFRYLGAGNLFFQTAAFTNNGLVEASAGQMLNWAGTNSFTQGATGTFRKVGAGTLAMTVASTFNAGSVNAQAGTLFLFSALFTSTPQVTWTSAASADIRFSSATLGGVYTGNASGSIGSDNIALASNTTLDIDGNGWTVNGDISLVGRTLTNTGLMTVPPLTRSMLNGTFNNAADGQFLSSTGTFFFQALAMNNAGLAVVNAASQWLNWTGTNSMTNTGTLRKTGTGSLSITVPFTHSSGRIESLGGEIVFNSGSTDIAPAAQWQVDAAASIRFSSQTLSGTIQAAPVGFMGTDATLAVRPASDLTLNVTGAGWRAGGALQGNARSVTNRGLYISDAVSNSLLNVAFNNAAGATFRGQGATTFFQICAFTNAGTFDYQGGDMLDWTGTNSFTNTGTLNKSNATNNTFNVPIVNSGTFNISGGGCTSMNFRQTAGTTNLLNSTMASATPLLLQGGSFIGTGNTGPINNSGAQLDIDPPGLPFIGTLTLSGPYVNSNLGTLIIDFTDATTQDRLLCQGSPVINGGTLRLRVPAGPSLTGQVLEIVRGTQPASGAFTTATVNTSNVQVRTYAQGNSIYAFFAGFFDALAYCDIADDQGNALPPAPDVPNNGVTEGDYNFFFSIFFDGCAI